MYEFLKKLFGAAEDGQPVALTYEQLEEKLAADKEVKIVNLADGGYVSKDKFDAKETELAGVKVQLTEANETIQSYKDMDVDGIKQSVTDWESKYNKDTQDLKDQLAQQAKDHSLDMFLNGYQFTSKAAKDGIRAAFVGKQFPYENGQFIGAKEYIETLKNDDDYKGAFVEDVIKPTEPTTPPEPIPPALKPQFSALNPIKPQPKPKVSLAELMRKKNENPNAEIKFE